jgi:5'-3' exonuclease
MIAPEEEQIYSNLIALIDADFIKYLVIDDLVKAKKEDRTTTFIIDSIEQRLDNIMPNFHPKAKIYAFTCPLEDNYRSKIARTKRYKGNRIGRIPAYKEQPQHAKFILDYIKEKYLSLEFDDLEADDIVSFLQCEDTFIYSRDKDLNTVPGKHMNPGDNTIYEISLDEAVKNLMIQMLLGDTSTDNIPGIKGFGPKSLEEKKIAELSKKKIVGATMMEYMKYYPNNLDWLDHFVEQYSLLRMVPNRGEWMQEKYRDAFTMLNILKKIPNVTN